MKKAFMTCLVLLMALALCAPLASFASDDGKTLVFAIGAEPIKLDPPNQTDNPSEMVIRTIYDGLVDFGPNMEIVPRVAKSWDISKDGLTYTFHLRKGVKFHDGTPLNAEAVVFSVSRNLDPDHRTRRTKLYLPFIESIKAADEYTVVMKLKNPFGAILAHFAHAAGSIVSPAAVKKYGDKLAVNPVGCGPYKFKEWVPGDRIVLVANKDYWGPKPKLEKVVFKPVPEAGSRVVMLETGEADLVYPVPIIEVDRLNASKVAKVESSPTARAMYAGMNIYKKPFNDVRVRQAINYAINKKSIVKNILKGMASPSKSMMGSLVWGYTPSGYYDYDPKKAKKLLAEAGYPNGFEISFWTPEGRYPMDAQISEAVVGMLNKVGIKAKLRKWEWASYLKNLRKKPEEAKYDMFYIGWSPSTGDADWALRPLFATDMWAPEGNNRQYYSSKKVDEGLLKGMKTADPEKRKAVYAEVQKELVKDAAWGMLVDMVQSVGMVPTLMGVESSPLEFVLVRNAYFKK